MTTPRSAVLAGLAVLTLLAGCSGSSESPSAESGSDTSSAAPTAEDAEPSVVTPVLAHVLAAPIPVPGTDGKVHLAYELQLTNAMGSDVTVRSLAVTAGDRTLLTLDGPELAGRTRLLGDAGTPTATLGAGRNATVWLDVAIDPSQGTTPAVPERLSHTVVVDVSTPSPPLLPATVTAEVAPVTVSTHAPAVIAPPLDGPGWLNGDGCCTDMTAHRMALNPINGALWVAERFAIDYVQLSPQGTVTTGDPTKLESYPYFGDDVHAVADGPVVAVVDGLPEQTPGTAPTGLRLDEYGGNHVVQDIGDGNYAFYAHLKTASVTVSPGEQLTAGQVVGSLGNSGNTDAPHLHFHVMDGPDPLRANGIPFEIRSFDLTGRVTSYDALGPLLAGRPAPMVAGFAPRTETNTSPLNLDVMTYAVG